MLAALSCSETASFAEGTFELTRISGLPVPLTVVSATTVEGIVYEYQIVSGTVTFSLGTFFEQNLRARHVWNGVPLDTATSVRLRGIATIVGRDISVDYRDPGGFSATRTYTLSADGTQLSGREVLFGLLPGEYEYVRR